MFPHSWILFLAALWLCFCCFVCEPARGLVNFNASGTDERKKFRDEFDWIAYLQIYPDLDSVFTTKDEASNHYSTAGKAEGRKSVRTLPALPGFTNAVRKLTAYTKATDKAAIDERTLILYNLHPIDSKGDTHGIYELLLNNLQIFLYATYKDDSERSSNFYWFNVINPEENQFYQFVKNLPQANVATVERGVTPSNMFAHLRTLFGLRSFIKGKFRTVLLLSNHVRGPFAFVEGGLWVKEYTKLLFQSHNGLVGSTMACDPYRVQPPAIHSHVMMLRTTSILNLLLVEFNKFKKSNFFTIYTDEGYEMGINRLIIAHGWNISALINYHRMKQVSFNHTCLPHEIISSHPETPLISDPNQRCDLKPDEMIFFKWNNLEIINHYEKYCDNILHYMSSLLQQYKQYNESLVLHLSEGMRDGEVHHASIQVTGGHYVQVKHAFGPEADKQSVEKLRDFFDWRAYLEFYPDLGGVLSNKEDAFHHYVNNGRYENRFFPKIFPVQPGLSVANRKLQQFLTRSNSFANAGERTFICYNLHMNQNMDSYEVIINNIMLFRHAVLLDSSPESVNFYWINIIGENNYYERHIDIHNQWNVAIVTRSAAPSDLFVHLRTFALLKHTLKHKFKAIFCLNSGTRGPLYNIPNGAWLAPFHQLLFHSHVGLVGPTVLCDASITPEPYVPLYAFLLRANLISLVLSEFGSFKRVNNFQVYTNKMYEVGFSSEMIKHGWRIASLLDSKRFGSKSFNDTCNTPHYPTQSMYVTTISNPALWCNLKAEEVVFFHWNGIVFAENYVCPELKHHMLTTLSSIQKQAKAEGQVKLKLRVPEVLKGGEIIHLYREYDEEVESPIVPPAEEPKNVNHVTKDKVCFLVRSCEFHDMSKVQESNKYKEPIDIFDETGILDIIISLRRQTDPNWEAVFFITDDRHFGPRLASILREFNDSRLQFFDVPPQYRPKYSGVDAGYTPTDYVIRQYIYNSNNRCKWFSTSNADNVYGSEIVYSVRNYEKRLRSSETLPEMILVAIDSRNFGELDYTTRQSKDNWQDYCKGLVSMLTLNELSYTVQPRPQVGKVDLAGAFLNTDRFIEENVLFSNFTDAEKYPCKGCQDGYMIEYLMIKGFWQYVRLPLEGMKSIVFHGPSPTWCIASGMVWFDHPKVSRVRCIPSPIVKRIRESDKAPTAIEFRPDPLIPITLAEKTHTVFDWDYFDTNGKKLCLRFTEKAFAAYSEATSFVPLSSGQDISIFDSI